MRLVPHPVLSAALLVLWLWLQESLALGHLLLGAALGLALPLYLDAFVPRINGVPDTRRLLAFVARVLGDILIANVVVTARVLGPRSRLRPAFVRVPLDLEDARAIAVLASTVSLTPGTVSAELAPDRRHLVVHALTLAADEDLVSTIKQRYERPIKELFR